MAKFMKKAAQKRRSIGVSREKFEALKSGAASAARRAREVAGERMEQLITVAAPGAFGALQARVSVPTVAGIEPTLLYGAAMGAVGMAAKGKAGKALLASGIGLLAAGSYLVGTGLRKAYGNATVGEDDDGETE